MNVYRKINALVPSERDKICRHEYFAWTGRTPCTGRVRCPMCGTSWIDLPTAEVAQKKLV